MRRKPTTLAGQMILTILGVSARPLFERIADSLLSGERLEKKVTHLEDRVEELELEVERLRPFLPPSNDDGK